MSRVCKSTLVNDILAAVLANRLNGARVGPRSYTRVTTPSGMPVGGSIADRAHTAIQPATYTVFDKAIRTRSPPIPRPVQPDDSFNVKGGR